MSVKNDDNFVDILHSDVYLSTVKIQKLWDIVCEHADGVDVESVRKEFGFKNTISEKRKTIQRLQFVTKGKIGFKSWDRSMFQIEYVWGLRLSPPSATLRKGVNSHLMEEIFGKMYLDNKEYYQNEFSTMIDTEIREFISEELKRILTDIIEQSIGNPFDLKDLEEIFGKEESMFFKTAINKITDNYMYRYKYLKSIHVENIWDRLFPIFNELVLWDTEEWTNGKVDSVFDTGMKNVILPVDYKFGAPKESYYMPSVELELTFYKMLLESHNAEYAYDYFGDRQKWKPRRVDKAAMWYILDTPENGIIEVNYSDNRKNEKMLEAYHSAIYEYWDDLNNMNYGFEKFYGYNKLRFDNYCNKKDDKDNWDCPYRPVCELKSSFVEENFLEELI